MRTRINQEKQVVALLEQLGRATTKQVGERLKVSDMQAHSLLLGLATKGMVDHVGQNDWAPIRPSSR